VRHLYVLGSARRHGVGQALVAAIVQTAHARFDVLRLRTSNPEAARLYERLGFQPAPGLDDCSHVMTLR
jgi:GNAT superfamily N-acetyltransferase